MRTDAQLLAEDDARAFGELYRRHVRRVHAWFARRIEWAAADLAAETVARAWMRRCGFRDQHDGSALPWLLGIAHNVLRESARRDRIESQARERLGLPLGLAEEDGYTAWCSRRRSTSSPTTSVRFGTCEALDASARAEALLDLRALHPGAAVDRTEAGYAAARARLSAGGGVR